MTAGNLTHAEVSGIVWDVLVIGAGPGGAVAAHQMANAGYRTLLVDRQAFPRTKVCGACLNARGVEILSLLGLKNALSDVPSVPLKTFELACGNRRASIPLPAGRGMSRRELDAALVNEAILAGASWLPSMIGIVGELSNLGSSRMVELTNSVSHQRRVAHARVVLVADGLGSPSLRRRAVEFPTDIVETSRIGVGGTIPPQPGTRWDHTIHMSVSRHGYVGHVILADGSVNVAAAVDATFLKTQSDVASGIKVILAESNTASLPIGDVEWKGTPPLSRKMLRPASTRVLVLGDAAGYVEPFTGEGMAWAILSAAAAARLAPRGLSHWSRDVEDQWLDLTRNLIQRQQRVCRVLAWALRSYKLAYAATHLLASFPMLASPIAGHSGALSGHVKEFLRSPVVRSTTSSTTSARLVSIQTSNRDLSR